ncbi:MAG: ribonuclease D [Coriobacteriia bacterium]|nr:ribonuclease D [Coriobacteriia bacterium]
MYVTDTQALVELVGQLRTSPVVAVDTEFMRERTYFARLCLIQLASDDVAAIVDPLVIEDLSPLRDLMVDPNVVKVFHAGSQDLEIFYRLLNEATAPVFDSQVAATLAGFPQQVGYGALVKEMMGVTLDKGDTYTDWAKRPLSDTQVEYALNDVRYLPEMYRRLVAELEQEGRLAWLSADFSRMEDSATYACLPSEQWRRVKRVSSLNRRQLAVAREVAAWREIEAQRRDVPKRWVLGDESVVEIARRAPKTPEELAGIRGVSDKIGRGAQKGVLQAVLAGVAVLESDLPVIAKRRRVQGDVDGAVDLMIALVRTRAREHGVAMPLLASRDDLERLAGGEREASPLLEGWRRTMVGDELVALLDGTLAMRLKDGNLVIEARPAKAAEGK